MTFELYYELKEEFESIRKLTKDLVEDLNQLEAGVNLLEDKVSKLEKTVKEAQF